MLDFDCKSRMWISLSFLLLIFSFVSTESKILKTNSQDKFVAAVYEHKPITALPICYEMGEYDKIFEVKMSLTKYDALVPRS